MTECLLLLQHNNSPPVLPLYHRTSTSQFQKHNFQSVFTPGAFFASISNRRKEMIVPTVRWYIIAPHVSMFDPYKAVPRPNVGRSCSIYEAVSSLCSHYLLLLTRKPSSMHRKSIQLMMLCIRIKLRSSPVIKLHISN